MKKILLTVIIAVMGVLCTEARNHTVARGETLESIAKVYNIPVSDLIAANPGADQLFYVGLKLTIPEITATSTTATPSNTTNMVGPDDTNSAVETTPQTPTESTEIESSDEDSGPGWTFVTGLGVGFPSKQEAQGVKYNALFTYNIDICGAYWVTEKEKGLFASVGIGYFGKYDSFKIDKDDYSSDSHFISIPVKIGYAFANENKKFALIPYVGVDLAMSVADEINQMGIKKKVKTGKFTSQFKLGAVIRILGFDLGGYYALPLGKETKSQYTDDGYFGVSLMFGL